MASQATYPGSDHAVGISINFVGVGQRKPGLFLHQNGDHRCYYKQGPHDGLCGFVAALNALRFLLRCTDHPVARDDDAAFFDEAVECLARVPGCDLRILKATRQWGYRPIPGA